MNASKLFAILVLGACSGSSGEADWMASVDDRSSIAELSIPGSHDSGARFEPYPGTAKTQDLTIAEQLEAGVRYFDVRCRHFQDSFLIYHGPIDQNQTYDEVLATFSSFLDEHPDEAILASVKEEGVPDQNTRSFEATFATYIEKDPMRWDLAPTVPRLGEARGKIVLFRRFAATGVPLGVDATAWPDNQAKFSIDNADAHLRIEDYYNLPDNEVKWTAIMALFADAAAGDPDVWMLTYTSGFQTIMALPNIEAVSDDINARLDALLAVPENAHEQLGTVVMDFVTAERVGKIIDTNDRDAR